MKTWENKRYHSLNAFLREKFQDKVYKISLDAGFSCPNRDGTIHGTGCIFCSERGSGDFAGDRNFSITRQFEDIRCMMEKKWHSGKYIAYFQAYTNTYAEPEVLREKYREAISKEGVVALSIATRPDCLGAEVLDVLEEFRDEVYTFVELGLQTVSDETGRKINRGYDLPVFEEALEKLRSIGIDVVVHVIFGLPGESLEDMKETVRYLAGKDIQGVKFHLLHLMKDTPMVHLYERGKLTFLTMEEYVSLVAESIAMLPESVVIHRTTGDAPRDLLIGPLWSLKKWEVLNAIDQYFVDHDLYQGKNYSRKETKEAEMLGTGEKMKIDVILTGKEVSQEQVKGTAVVVVDVLRATSVIITALKNGAKSVVPVLSVEEALLTKKKLEQVVLGGERKAQKIEGFDLSNSPLEYTHTAIHDKNVILTTTNGTLAITRSSAAKRVLIGALLNATAVAKEAVGEDTDIIVVNSGTNGQFSMDDFITTGALIHEMLQEKSYELTDIARTSLFIYESHPDLISYVKEAKHYKVLEELHLEEDLAYCFQKDLLKVVPEYKNGVIRLSENVV